MAGLKSAVTVFLPTTALGLVTHFAVLPAAAVQGADVDVPASATSAPGARESDAAQTLHLTAQRQHLAGLKAVTVRRSALGPESAVQGRIVDISPLLELRTRYRATLAESRIAETALALAQKNRDRLATLSREAIIAAKELIQAESLLAAETTRAATLRLRVREIREESLHTWGPEMFRLAIEGDSRLWDALLKREKVLALVALPASGMLASGTRTAHVSRNRDRQRAVRAELLSAAPNTDNFVQGETYFFHLDAAHLRTGMRVDVWIPRAGATDSGVFLPASAVVWYGGLPWVYVQSGAEVFSRIAIVDYEEYGEGWFVRGGLQDGLRVVTAGAQLLLSEEMRGQIPQEDAD